MTPPTTPPILLRYDFVIRTDYADFGDFVVHPNGYWVKAEDALALSQALQQAREERDKLREAAENVLTDPWGQTFRELRDVLWPTSDALLPKLR